MSSDEQSFHPTAKRPGQSFTKVTFFSKFLNFQNKKILWLQLFQKKKFPSFELRHPGSGYRYTIDIFSLEHIRATTICGEQSDCVFRLSIIEPLLLDIQTVARVCRRYEQCQHDVSSKHLYLVYEKKCAISTP